LFWKHFARPAHPDICVMAEQGPSGNKLQSTVDVRSKREQVLSRYSEFKNTARLRRERLEAARHFQQFRRDADELEAWINEKIQIVSDESYKERTNLQAKIQKHQAFEAETAAHNNAILTLKSTGRAMIDQKHFAAEQIQVCAPFITRAIQHSFTTVHRIFP